jgi:hypothetical protein
LARASFAVPSYLGKGKENFPNALGQEAAFPVDFGTYLPLRDLSKDHGLRCNTLERICLDHSLQKS